jgi:hypothetical protein
VSRSVREAAEAACRRCAPGRRLRSPSGSSARSGGGAGGLRAARSTPPSGVRHAASSRFARARGVGLAFAFAASIKRRGRRWVTPWGATLICGRGDAPAAKLVRRAAAISGTARGLARVPGRGPPARGRAASPVVCDDANDGVVCRQAVPGESRKENLLLYSEVLMSFLLPEPEKRLARGGRGGCGGAVQALGDDEPAMVVAGELRPARRSPSRAARYGRTRQAPALSTRRAHSSRRRARPARSRAATRIAPAASPEPSYAISRRTGSCDVLAIAWTIHPREDRPRSHASRWAPTAGTAG